jgi:hypothetical protein
MHNYEHEIACPDNRAIRKYLWEDYFHDSKITDIKFDKSSNKVVLTLESNTDLNDAFEKFKMNHEEFWEYVSRNINKFTYELIFIGAQHVQIERRLDSSDYINGRFKDTALVNKLSIGRKKKLYHFRIKVADGFLDVIFSDFNIRKKEGNVDYKVHNTSFQFMPDNLLDEIEIVKLAKHGEDFERYKAMKELYEMGYPNLLDIVRHNMDLNDELEDTCFYACFLLGILGEQEDIINLLHIFCRIDCFYKSSQYLIKKNILDAIEKITGRAGYGD